MTTKQRSKRPLPNGYIKKEGEGAYDVHDHDDYQPTPHYMTSCPTAFKIRVHANRDRYGPGKVMTIAKDKIKTFDNLLGECGEKVKPPWGCVRRIYTSSGRHRIQTLDDLKKDGVYVITGTEAFQDHHYRDIPERLRPPRQKGPKKIDINRIIKPIEHSPLYKEKSGAALRLAKQKHGIRLKCAKNGDFAKPFTTVSIPHNSVKHFNQITDEITSKLNCKVKGLFRCKNGGGFNRSDFERIENVDEFHNDDRIVVMLPTDHEIKTGPYREHGMDNFKIDRSPRQTFPYIPFSRHKVLPSISSGKQSAANTTSPFSNPPGSERRRKNKKSRGQQEVDYDKDTGGVYRAKKQNNARGAHQEEIHTKEKTTPIPAGTELNKQPSKEMKQNAENASQTKTKNEVKKGGKSGKDMNKVSVLPPIVDEGSQKSDTYRVPDDMKEIKEGQVKETVEKYEQKAGEGMGQDDLFVDEKEPTPKDLKTDDVIEMSEREVTPVHLQSTDVEVNKPPHSTTPPQGKVSQLSGKVKERVDEDAAAAKIQAGARGYKARKEYQMKKAEKMRQDEERRLQEDEARFREDEAHEREMMEAREREMAQNKKMMDEDQAATRIQASFKGYKARKGYNERRKQGQQ